MALDKVGTYSLQAVNQWINTINSNLQGTSRTAYKSSRISFSDGIGLSKLGASVDTPPATLTVQATTLDWSQGGVTNTDSSTDFAIQGEGFFVVTNDAGEFFVTRDGEFHWDHEGYLANSAGLKVLSSGQDFIRMHGTDRNDSFNIDGASTELDFYGDKSLLLVDFDNLQGLRMSKYGSTVFEVPGDIPLRVQNSFDSTTDGVSYIDDDPIFEPVLDDPGFVPGGFSVDFGSNGVLAVPGFNPAVDSINSIVGLLDGVAGVSATLSANHRLEIINTGADNRIVFDGPNGQAIRDLFKLGNNNPDNGTGGGNIMKSSEDIDNGDGFNTLHTILSASLGSPINSMLDPQDASFTHIKATDPLVGNQTGGTIVSDTRNITPGLSRGSHILIGESQTTGAFDIDLDFRVSNDGASLITFSFGQDDPHSVNSGGFEVRYNSNTGVTELFRRLNDPNSLPQLVTTLAPMPTTSQAFAGVPPSPAAAATATHNLRARLDAETRTLTFSIDGATQSVVLVGDRDLFTGSISVGNRDNVLELHSLYADFKHRYNTERQGMMVSVSPSDPSRVDIKLPNSQQTGKSRIIQSAKETSNASLTEYVPMLATAQKLFSAISKIISTHNNVTDDLNSLIR